MAVGAKRLTTCSCPTAGAASHYLLNPIEAFKIKELNTFMLAFFLSEELITWQ
jgi:hypothetical protein